jgi:hypothetical protein
MFPLWLETSINPVTSSPGISRHEREGRWRAVTGGSIEMTSEQSKLLKVGARVCFNGDPADSGNVTSIEARYVTIKWNDGHESLSGHNEMKRVELVEPPGAKRK